MRLAERRLKSRLHGICAPLRHHSAHLIANARLAELCVLRGPWLARESGGHWRATSAPRRRSIDDRTSVNRVTRAPIVETKPAPSEANAAPAESKSWRSFYLPPPNPTNAYAANPHATDAYAANANPPVSVATPTSVSVATQTSVAVATQTSVAVSAPTQTSAVIGSAVKATWCVAVVAVATRRVAISARCVAIVAIATRCGVTVAG